MSTFVSSLVLASNNAGKVAEFNRLLSDLSIDVVTQGSLGVSECDEPFFSFVENALHKARHASRMTGLPALADDSGLCVPALNGAPGVFSARYADKQGQCLDVLLPKDTRNSLQLIRDLSDSDDKRAYFYCVLVLVRHADDPQPLIVDGQWWGEVVNEARGEGGFGYDPYFYVDGLQKTAAELDKSDKNAISHRGIAVQALLHKLRQNPLP